MMLFHNIDHRLSNSYIRDLSNCTDKISVITDLKKFSLWTEKIKEECTLEKSNVRKSLNLH